MAVLRRLGWLCLCACALPPVASAATLDLSAATIVVAAPASPRSHTYAQLLSDEVFKRVFVRWPIANGTAASGAGGVTITLGTDSPAEVDRSSPRAEGFDISVGAAGVRITGADQRGLLYGVGRLIRTMNLTLSENYFHARRTTLTVPTPLAVHSVPDR